MFTPRAHRALPLAALAALLAAAPAGAQTSSRTDLRLSSVGSTTASAAPGNRVDAAIRVVNRGRRSGKGALTLTLRTSPTSRTARTLAKRTTSTQVRGRTTRYGVTGTVPAGTPVGDYVLVACVRVGSRKASCRTGRKIRVIKALPTPAPAPAPVPVPTPAPVPAPLSDQLRTAITPERLRTRLADLQRIADENGGNRASGLPGYGASVQYITSTLRAAGYSPTVQPFSFDLFTDLGPTTFTSAQVPLTADDVAILEYSGSGDVTDAPVTAVDTNVTTPEDATSGCEPEDFAGFPAGNVALVQRGVCDFGVKVRNAQDAGASAVVIFNQGNGDDRTDVFTGTLGAAASIPAVGTSFAVGRAFVEATAPTASVSTTTTVTTQTTANVIADTPTGDPSKTVVVGSHLDSVAEGPGINDNGTGSAFNLELAVRLAESGVQPANRMRFAWWGAEESGLLGSYAYTDSRSQQQLDEIALDLNFDMLGSPNFARLIYDGDGNAFDSAGPAGSDTIERAFESWFASQGQGTAPTAFDGRSDYAGFIDNGIPAGGLFSGAEEIKTEEDARLFGGTAGLAFDPNYHLAGDTLDNVNMTGFKQLADGAADVAAKFATGQLTVPARTARTARRTTRAAFAYRGPHLTR